MPGPLIDDVNLDGLLRVDDDLRCASAVLPRIREQILQHAAQRTDRNRTFRCAVAAPLHVHRVVDSGNDFVEIRVQIHLLRDLAGAAREAQCVTDQSVHHT